MQTTGIFPNSNATLSPFSVSPDDFKSVRNKIIGQVALDSLKESLLGFAMTGLACFFVATSAIPTLLIITVSVLAVNLIVRSFAAIASYQLYLMKQENPNAENIYLMDKLVWLFRLVCAIDFSVLSLATTSTIIHEGGHALAALAVYKNAHPTIQIFPLSGGNTSYYTQTLTSVGNVLGPRFSQVVVSAAGPVLGTLCATAQLGLAHNIKDKYPQLSLYLVAASLVALANNVFYALSALWQKAPAGGHDFYLIWKTGGIHPLTAVVGIIALPVFAKLTLYAFDYLRKNSINLEKKSA